MIRFIFTPCLPGGPQGFFNDLNVGIMKKIKQWLNRRNDRRLRKWCVKYGYVNGFFICKEAKAIYDWVTSKQPQSHTEVSNNNIFPSNECECREDVGTDSTESKTIIQGGHIECKLIPTDDSNCFQIEK